MVVSCRQQKGGIRFLLHSGSLCLLTECRSSVNVEMAAGLMEEEGQLTRQIWLKNKAWSGANCVAMAIPSLVSLSTTKATQHLPQPSYNPVLYVLLSVAVMCHLVRQPFWNVPILMRSTPFIKEAYHPVLHRDVGVPFVFSDCFVQGRAEYS